MKYCNRFLISNDTNRSGVRIRIGVDFNANVGSPQWSDERHVVGQWGFGLGNARGATLISWILMNGLQIAGRQSPANNVDDSWTCQRTMDGTRLHLHYTLTDARTCVDTIWHDHLIPIGLDHRCVHCLLRWRGVRPSLRNRRLILKNWMPILDADGRPSVFQSGKQQGVYGVKDVFCDYAYIDRTALADGKVEACYILLQQQKERWDLLLSF